MALIKNRKQKYTDRRKEIRELTKLIFKEKYTLKNDETLNARLNSKNPGSYKHLLRSQREKLARGEAMKIVMGR